MLTDPLVQKIRQGASYLHARAFPDGRFPFQASTDAQRALTWFALHGTAVQSGSRVGSPGGPRPRPFQGAEGVGNLLQLKLQDSMTCSSRVKPVRCADYTGLFPSLQADRGWRSEVEFVGEVPNQKCQGESRTILYAPTGAHAGQSDPFFHIRLQDYLIAEGSSDQFVAAAGLFPPSRYYFSQDGTQWSDLDPVNADVIARASLLTAQLTGDPSNLYLLPERLQEASMCCLL